ncbi:peptidoglycan DD-metalloendopeptidase family protein [Pseudomonas alcaliphila]|uniref:Peptidoglycan DD-metalloendopeptidase family protein n=1 Tax=Ectopseudomonas alcaliphila TaxID=101564 RepID=A0ABU4Q5N3_9GAMM|nr:peptidoglycan DD-metalloendopeptidase family protein [Pseudomonas alcaliphila]MDX5994901.1 peptidoglycan DD-metalloendopeptidase family protein [Pseudomonas alcaliphila]
MLVRAVAVFRLPLALLAASALAGCVSSPPGGVQVVDRGQNQGRAPVVQRQPVRNGHYVVQRGDTLYSIAFRFGWDWKALAAHNGLRDPYLIRVGQTIRFDNRPLGSSQPVASTPPPATSPAVTQPVPSRPPVAVTAPPATQPARPPVANTPATTPVTPVSRSASGWSWPTEGTVISRFSSNGSLNKGIDIAGQLGQPVLAASDGSVVYAGSGLRGYGELIIIKHSDTYVSAYGHNRRLLVREGQQVKAGQSIAEMGSTGADRVKLHFEIRRQGKPVDPLQYLPRR